MPKPKPSDLELQVLTVLWDRGPSTVREVLAAMPDRKRRAYTSVLSVMQVMEKKGLLTHDSQGRAHVYKPTVTRSQTLRPMLRALVRNVFGGSTASAVQHLLRETDVKDDELAEIGRLLDEQKDADGQGGGTKS
jgi:predicted transcriptional regulator